MAAPSKSPKSPLTKCGVVDPIETSTYPTNGLWTVLTTTTTSAPAPAVLETSLDVSTWSKWNTFVPRVDILSLESTSSRLGLGMFTRFHNKLKENGPKLSASHHTTVSVDKMNRDGHNGFSIVWKTVGVPGGDWVLRAERIQKIMEVKLDDENVETQYRTWGTLGGPVAYLL